MKERMMVMEGFNKQEELNHYVDHLFRKYKPTQQIRELKAEILSNLEAKVADLTASGMNDHEAVQQAKNSIRSVDHLVDGNIRVFIHPFRLELVQMGLLFSLIAWILTIPFRIFGLGVLLNTILMALCIVGSIVYFAMYFSSKRKRRSAASKKICQLPLGCETQTSKLEHLEFVYHRCHLDHYRCSIRKPHLVCKAGYDRRPLSMGCLGHQVCVAVCLRDRAVAVSCCGKTGIQI